MKKNEKMKKYHRCIRGQGSHPHSHPDPGILKRIFQHWDFFHNLAHIFEKN